MYCYYFPYNQVEQYGASYTFCVFSWDVFSFFTSKSPMFFYLFFRPVLSLIAYRLRVDHKQKTSPEDVDGVFSSSSPLLIQFVIYIICLTSQNT